MKALRLLGCMAVATIPLMAADLAWAQAQTSNVPVTSTKKGPAPLIGVGLPAVGGALLALLLVRRFRQKE